ncbi:MAG: hypothetical protein ACWGQW_12760, partial [bacterium]
SRILRVCTQTLLGDDFGCCQSGKYLMPGQPDPAHASCSQLLTNWQLPIHLASWISLPILKMRCNRNAARKDSPGVLGIATEETMIQTATSDQSLLIPSCQGIECRAIAVTNASNTS